MAARFAGNGTGQVIDEELLEPMLHLAQRLMEEQEQTTRELTRVVEGRLAPYGTGAIIETRRGILGENRIDRARNEAVKANEERAKMLAKMLADLAKLVEYSHYIATETKWRMQERNRQLPQDVRGYGQLIAEMGGNAMLLTIKEVLKQYPDLSLRLIGRTTYR
jgi:hypothetical protein